MDQVHRRVEVEAEIDRGYSYARWKELEKVAVRTMDELEGRGSVYRDPSFVGVRYTVLDDLDRGDSVFIPAQYGLQHSRAAAIGKAKQSGWSIVTRKTFEGGKWGVRIFRLA